MFNTFFNEKGLSLKTNQKLSLFLHEMLNLNIYLFQCGNGGCLIELAQQLAVIMIGTKLSLSSLISISTISFRETSYQ